MLLMATEALIRYADLQSGLCKILSDEFGLEDDLAAAFDLPKSGQVTLGGEVWSFTRHGKGARFTRDSDSCVVDAADMIVCLPVALDAWRLIDYFESLNVQRTRVNQIDIDVTNKDGMDELFHTLIAKKFLAVVDGHNGLYIIA